MIAMRISSKLKTKFNLIEELADKKKLTLKLSALCVDAIRDEIVEALAKGKRVELRGFGTFGVKKHKAYKGRNPQNQKQTWVKAKKRPWFKPGVFSKDINSL